MDTRNDSIEFLRNEFGGRLRYVGQSCTPEYWDAMWAAELANAKYTRALRGHLPRHLRRTFLKWVSAGSRVLEAGCGLARFTVAAHARGYRAEGIDYGPKVIERLKEIFPHIPFTIGDVRCLEGVADGANGAVYSPGVCEHFEDGPEIILRETHRILEPGGIALIHTPYFNGLRRMFATTGMFDRPMSGEFYQYAFTKKEMSMWLERVGFRVMEVVPFDTLSTFRDHFPAFSKLTSSAAGAPVEYALNRTPLFKDWGHCAMWVARKG